MREADRPCPERLSVCPATVLRGKQGDPKAPGPAPSAQGASKVPGACRVQPELAVPRLPAWDPAGSVLWPSALRPQVGGGVWGSQPGKPLPAWLLTAALCAAGVSKQDIREQIWNHMEAQDIADFPRPVHHRIPNFKVAAFLGPPELGTCWRWPKGLWATHPPPPLLWCAGLCSWRCADFCWVQSSVSLFCFILLQFRG